MQRTLLWQRIFFESPPTRLKVTCAVFKLFRVLSCLLSVKEGNEWISSVACLFSPLRKRTRSSQLYSLEQPVKITGYRLLTRTLHGSKAHYIFSLLRDVTQLQRKQYQQKLSLHLKGELILPEILLLSPVKTRVWYCMHEFELENGLYHADNARAHVSYKLCSTTTKST